MSTPLILQRVRCGVDISTRSFQFLDELAGSGQAPTVWRASKCQFEFAFFFGNDSNRTLVTDFSDLASITIGAKSATNLTGLYMIPSKTVLVAAIGSISSDDWASKNPAKAQVTVDYTDAELNVAAGQYWLEVSAIDTAGENVMLGGTTLTVKESGIGGDSIAASIPSNRVPYIDFLNPTDGLYYRYSLTLGADGLPVPTLSNQGNV